MIRVTILTGSELRHDYVRMVIVAPPEAAHCRQASLVVNPALSAEANVV